MHQKKQNEILFDRMAALFALTLAAAYDYGSRIWVLFVTTAAVSLAAEAVCLRVRHQQFSRKNLDAAVSGIVLMMLFRRRFRFLCLSCPVFLQLSSGAACSAERKIR